MAISQLERQVRERVRFIVPSFNEADSIGGADQQNSVDKLPTLYTLRSMTNHDNMLHVRIKKCRGDIICEFASAGHPTKLGSEKYADTIEKAIVPFMAGWRDGAELSSVK